MKKLIKENWFKIGIATILFIIVLSIAYYLVIYISQRDEAESEQYDQQAAAQFEQQQAQQAADRQAHSNQSANDSNSQFICPENEPSVQQYVYDMAEEAADYKRKNPNMTDKDFMQYRYNQLVEHGCKQTLDNIKTHGGNQGYPVQKNIEETKQKTYRSEETIGEIGYKPNLMA